MQTRQRGYRILFGVAETVTIGLPQYIAFLRWVGRFPLPVSRLNHDRRKEADLPTGVADPVARPRDAFTRDIVSDDKVLERPMSSYHLSVVTSAAACAIGDVSSPSDRAALQECRGQAGSGAVRALERHDVTRDIHTEVPGGYFEGDQEHDVHRDPGLHRDIMGCPSAGQPRKAARRTGAARLRTALLLFPHRRGTRAATVP